MLKENGLQNVPKWKSAHKGEQPFSLDMSQRKEDSKTCPEGCLVQKLLSHANNIRWLLGFTLPLIHFKRVFQPHFRIKAFQFLTRMSISTLLRTKSNFFLKFHSRFTHSKKFFGISISSAGNWIYIPKDENSTRNNVENLQNRLKISFITRKKIRPLKIWETDWMVRLCKSYHIHQYPVR